MCDCRYDVNVTPDKRKVFLHHEAEMLQALQQVCSCLTPLFALDNNHSCVCPEATVALQRCRDDIQHLLNEVLSFYRL